MSWLVWLSQPLLGQSMTGNSLAQLINRHDSLLFSVGFNSCNIPVFQQLVSTNFEFYHDQAGSTLSKEAFIQGIQNNVCGLSYKARRELTPGSTAVYPLTKNGTLYGAVQTGRHRFYATEPGKPAYLTSSAQFTHVWQLENGEWKLIRGLSYDHQENVATSPPNFDNSAAVEAWLRVNKVPALALGYIQGGQLQAIQGYGELAKGKPAVYNSLFNTASLTKMVTTMLVLRLVNAGQWRLDEPLAKYWSDPDLKTDRRRSQLTTRHVLTQQSGFPNWRWQLPTKKLVFIADPGTRYGYSGEGFEYLRRALEAKFHQPMTQLAQQWLFTPLAMTDSHLTWDDTLDESRFAVPHDTAGRVLNFPRNRVANGADLLKTTIADYAKLLLAAGKQQGLSRSLGQQMVAPTTKTEKAHRSIGLGWFIYDQLGEGEYAISHGGDDPGAHSICFYLPQSGQGVIIFTNSDNGPNLYADIIRSFLKAKGQKIIDIELH